MEVVINGDNINLTIEEFMIIFNSFSSEEKRIIIKNISRDIFKREWDILDSELPDIEMPEDEIMSEIKQVRKNGD